jgi:hypothetical protein
MQYYIAKTVGGTFPAIVERVIESLKAEGLVPTPRALYAEASTIASEEHTFGQ